MHATTSERIVPTPRSLLRLAWPIVVSRSSQVIVGLCDALMVAHLGEGALAATTTGALNSLSLFILPMGTVFIVSSFASQFFGRGDPVGARRYAWYGLVVALATQVLCLAGLPLVAPAMGLFEFSPDVQSLITTYLKIRLLSGGAVVAIEALANYYGGLGNTRLPMAINVVAMVLNVAGNWLLIDGRLGLPAMGVAGAAWASVLSTLIAFALFLGIFLAGSRRAGRVLPKLYGAELVKMLRFGLPSGFNWFFEFFAFIFFVNVVVAGLGTTALAAMMAVMQLNQVSFMPAFAVSSAGAILVGQAIGANARQDVPRAVWMTFLVAGGWQTLVGVVYLLIPTVVFQPFVRDSADPELLRIGAHMLMLSAAWQFFDSAATTLAEALRAAGDTAFTLWVRIGVAWLVFAPGSWLTIRHWGGDETTAVLWLVGYVALLSAILYARFRSGAWKRFDLVEAASVAG